MLLSHFPRRQFRHVLELENEIAKQEHAIQANAQSPVRFELVERMSGNVHPPGFPRSLPYLVGSILGIRKSFASLRDNPETPKAEASAEFLRTVEATAQQLGVASVGCARVPRNLIFQGKAIAHDHVIVPTMEMDRESMALAPHPRTAVMVMETYSRLGKAANELAGILRQHGYSAHAGHPLMGVVLYPPLARLAGLGWQGLHGLLITPEFGPRVRLAAVFTSIENLPVDGDNAHGWIDGFCARCRRCIRDCPAAAILEEPVVHDTGQLTHIATERCFPYFAEHHGCSVCIKVCPFNERSYGELQRRFERGDSLD